MATIAKIHGFIREGANVFSTKWLTLTTANVDGEPLELPAAADQSVQVTGTFNGATVSIQGCNADDPSSGPWSTMHDTAGDLLQFTSAGIAAVAENVRYMRPFMTGGAGSTDLDVLVISRST